MNKIKESLTALIMEDIPGAVHINRKERVPISDYRFELVLKFIVKIACIIAGTVFLLNAEPWKVGAFLVFCIFFALIYFGMRD